ncbi:MULTISPECIES: RNA polymerase sigma factor SigF [unclassified Streptomyces]|uniref:RNA polymerase sigma factor SigF n=2 Tax=Streptomyces TaxID=1883 RepID=UPI003659FFF3
MSLISEQAAETVHADGTAASGEIPEMGQATAVEGALPWIEDTDKVAPKDARALSKLFFDRLQTLEEGTHEYQYARNTLIEMNLTLVHFAARRFRNRGNGDMEEIIQVGTIGLIKAIDRFDLSREVEFATFAVPYILGEIKRFFRDTTWAVHVPRRLQELRVELAKAKEEISAHLDHDPTVKELAEYLSITEEEVIDGLIASNGYTAGSLEAPTDGGESAATPTRTLADVMGEPDPAMEAVENLHALAPLLDELDERERRILELRFGQEMTQSQIGVELGVSQMHISRLLTGTLNKLRRGMLA